MGVYERQQKEKLIVQSAIKLFSSQGYHATKMDDVAKKAKMSKGLIYFYFKNKEDLYMAVTAKAFEQLTAVFKETQKVKDRKGMDLVFDLVDNFLAFTKENRMYHEAIMNFMGLVALYNDDRLRTQIDPLILESSNFEKLLTIHHEPAKLGAQIISLGIEDKSMRADLNPETAFYTIWSLMIGFERLSGPLDYLQKGTGVKPESWKEDIRQFVQVMLKGSIQVQKPKAVQGSLF
ncbi:MAG TPA: TetR/AcrR family transcriptional regulator [Cyclobacteriaceae bacterium]|nr:TetR/AcrR family transcriptional regulator [Cyclobacteriaceae bacterium]